LRFWLWRAKCIPLNVVAFLDEASDRLILRKVGGGYIFVHRELRDYFAEFDMKPTLENTTREVHDTVPTPNEKTAQKQRGKPPLKQPTKNRKQKRKG